MHIVVIYVLVILEFILADIYSRKDFRPISSITWYKAPLVRELATRCHGAHSQLRCAISICRMWTSSAPALQFIPISEAVFWNTLCQLIPCLLNSGFTRINTINIMLDTWYYYYWVPRWSRDQRTWLLIMRSRVRFPTLPQCGLCLERGPPSLVRTIG